MLISGTRWFSKQVFHTTDDVCSSRMSSIKAL